MPEYRFNDGRTITVDHDPVEGEADKLTYRLDGKVITDPEQIAALITEFRRQA
jgi:hypothetical protein